MGNAKNDPITCMKNTRIGCAKKTAGEVHEFSCAQKVSMYPEIGTAKNSCKIQPKFRPKFRPKFTPPLGQKFTPPLGQKFTPPLGPKFTPPLGQILWFRGKFTEVFWALEAINPCPNNSWTCLAPGNSSEPACLECSSAMLDAGIRA